MKKIDVPGFGPLELEHLVLDYNGTVAVDGEPVDGLKPALAALAAHFQVHVLTADTFGRVREKMADFPCRISILPEGEQDRAKQSYVAGLGPEKTVCIGNGRNDRLMLETARLGIAVILAEGAAAVTVASADIVCTGILDALDLLENPLRLVATLRS